MTTFMLKRGREIEIRLVSAFKIAKIRQAVKRQFIEEHGELKPPTYVATMGGGLGIVTWEEKHEYTKDNISEGTPEDKAAWKEYVRLQLMLSQKTWAKTAEVYLYRGVVEYLPEDDSWIREQEEDGIEVPESLREQRIHWIKTELLIDATELVALITVIQGRGQEVERAASFAAGMFRREVG